MDADFWLERWRENQIGFHLPEAHDLLVKHVAALKLHPGQTVFLPLCGKTHDIGWFLRTGLHVKGAELSELAVEQLFQELRVTPQLTEVGELRLYQAPGLDIWVGDIFALTPDLLGEVHAVYDRAALVALPAAMRSRYARHLAALTAKAQQLLITFTYDQALVAGPPFSVPADELERNYETDFALELLETRQVLRPLKGLSDAQEHCWHLRPRR